MMSGGADQNFGKWLRVGMTGCEFAKRLPALPERVAIEQHIGVDVPIARLNTVFDSHASAQRVAVAVFPSVTTDAAFISLMNALGRDERWTLRRGAKTSPDGGVLLALEWRTPSGEISDAMGFAPLWWMPTPRRSPHVAIAAWPGSRSNPFRGRHPTPRAAPGQVSFLDASHGFEAARYEGLWAKTTKNVAALMSEPPDDARLYRRAAFVVSEALAAHLNFAA